ncbi:MAG: ABC transporter ATP-binding protein [Planctomycetota bacterium]
MIELEHVSKTYDRTLAVDDLTLSVRQGEFFAFLGPNGAGKTTTIKLVAGLLRPNAGTIRVGGIDVEKDYLAAKAIMAYVPDQPYLYDKLSGREFLRFMGGLFGMNGGTLPSEIDRIAEQFNLRDFVDDLTDTYSHGMKQRLTLAATLLHRPKVVVVDEPLVGLDPQSARLVKNILRDEAKRGTTIFMSTHVLSIAEETADRIGIIRKGKLVAVGTLDEIRAVWGGGGNLEDLFLRIVEEDGAPRG